MIACTSLSLYLHLLTVLSLWPYRTAPRLLATVQLPQTWETPQLPRWGVMLSHPLSLQSMDHGPLFRTMVIPGLMPLRRLSTHDTVCFCCGQVQEKEKPDLMKSLMENVLTQPALYLLALSYFFIYTVRQGVTSWFVFYLIQVCLACNPSGNFLWQHPGQLRHP